MTSAHVDHFAQDHLPPADQQPEFLFNLPALQFGAQLNCATALLDQWVAAGVGGRLCIQGGGMRWTYADLLAQANRIANVLVHGMGLVPGNRVLLRAPNTPLLAACWFAVMKAGGIAVATMPLLRAKELGDIIDKAEISHALCDARLSAELKAAAASHPVLQAIRWFNADARTLENTVNDTLDDTVQDSLEAAMAQQPATFENVATAADDTCILAFTSGTTGVPKATMHFHRDIMAICACWPGHVLKPRADDVFIGSPPMAFTFGLGGLLLFPMTVGASTVLLEQASPQHLVDAIAQYHASVLFTGPTSYRVMAAHGAQLVAAGLKRCVSAGETLPAATRALWRQATGIELIDGIGATELLHIFISADEAQARAGATGKPVPGYIAQVVDDAGQPLPPNTVGRLAVKGPTGCRYLADARQTQYVQNGWNLTGDAYLMDDDGYFHYQSRTDDMIISAGYSIAAPEVEDALLKHPAVAECGVIGVADAERGQIVKAYVVLVPGQAASPEMAKTLQDFVKQTVAPYKFPRAVAFVTALPRTETGKLQRFRLQAASPA